MPFFVFYIYLAMVSDSLKLEKLPSWLKRPIGNSRQLADMQRIIKTNHLHTICEEARCPNRAECYSQGTATFLLLGNICTRSCAFCQVDKGKSPLPLDPMEPEQITRAIELLSLRYVVLTSVARDDLHDGGASRYAEVIRSIRNFDSNIQIEVLTPDFWNGQNAYSQQKESIAQIVELLPACYNHNIETVERLQGPVRRGARYDRSLRVLSLVKELDSSVATKSGLMLGHGETVEEIIETLRDLRSVGCDRITLGQYMRPGMDYLPVKKYWDPEEFDYLGQVAISLGFAHVRSGPLVRSSYHAAS